MPLKVRPQVGGWKLLENTRRSLVYSCPELGLCIRSIKTKGIWEMEYFEHGELIDTDEVRLKDTVISKSKGFMYHHAVIPEFVPILKPGEKIVLRAGKFKSPSRVTQFSRHRR